MDLGAAISKIFGNSAADVFPGQHVVGATDPGNPWPGWAPALVADKKPSGSPNTPGNSGSPVQDSGAYSAAASGGGAPSYNPADLAYLDDQQSRLQAQQGSTNTALQNGLAGLLDSYNQQVSSTNLDRSRALEDLNTKTADTTKAKDTALNRNDTQGRTLADSLRQRIGMAAGANSSAYQLTAPGAVAKQVSDGRSDIQTNFGTNFRNLATTGEREKTDFENLLQNLSQQKNSRESDFRSGILDKQNQIDQSLSEVARQRALLKGGGYNQVRSAMAPYDQAISGRQSQIDNLFNQFRTPYNVTPVDVKTPNLLDYMTQPGQIAQNQTQPSGGADPFSLALQKKQQEDYNPLIG